MCVCVYVCVSGGARRQGDSDAGERSAAVPRQRLLSPRPPQLQGGQTCPYRAMQSICGASLSEVAETTVWQAH